MKKMIEVFLYQGFQEKRIGLFSVFELNWLGLHFLLYSVFLKIMHTFKESHREEYFMFRFLRRILFQLIRPKN